MSGRTPDQVLGEALTDLPEGAYLTAAIVIVEYHLPTADEGERGPWLAWRADNTVGKWQHLGMIESAAGDFRKALLEQD